MGGAGQLPPPPVAITQGQCFQFAVPQGWRILQEGQFAVLLVAPDDTAVTLMVGNCGLPAGIDPIAYAYEKLSMGGATLGLQFGQPRPGRPLAGFPSAYEADCAYTSNGVPCRGVATVSVRPGYGSVDLVLTCASAQEAHWPGFASWLPGVVAHVLVTNGAAWGARGIQQQNIANAAAFGQQLDAHQQHSHDLQQALGDQRARSDEVRSHGRGEALTGNSWYEDPYGNPPQQLPNDAAVYWISRDGRVEPTDDPTYDPREGGDVDWQRMTRQEP